MFQPIKVSFQFLIFTAFTMGSVVPVHAQQPPAVDPSIKSTQLERFPLVKQVPAMKGFDFRARKIIVPAGASIGKHSHINRPGMVYVESGTIIEYRGSQSRKLVSGDTLIEDASTVHHYKNTSDEACVLIAFDLPVTQ